MFCRLLRDKSPVPYLGLCKKVSLGTTPSFRQWWWSWCVKKRKIHWSLILDPVLFTLCPDTTNATCTFKYKFTSTLRRNILASCMLYQYFCGGEKQEDRTTDGCFHSCRFIYQMLTSIFFMKHVVVMYTMFHAQCSFLARVVTQPTVLTWKTVMSSTRFDCQCSRLMHNLITILAENSTNFLFHSFWKKESNVSCQTRFAQLQISFENACSSIYTRCSHDLHCPPCRLSCRMYTLWRPSMNWSGCSGTTPWKRLCPGMPTLCDYSVWDKHMLRTNSGWNVFSSVKICGFAALSWFPSPRPGREVS